MNFTRVKRQDKAVCSNRVLGMGYALTLSLVSVLAGLSISSSAHAQQRSALAAVYGRGVHAYFAGNSSQAEQYFTQVIQAGSVDPRPYYFRAVLRLGQERQFEAENDMRIGAAYEARNPGAKHSIGRSLQRVQGSGRRTLEKFRRQARLDHLQQGRQQTRQRYEQLERRGPSVIRRAAPLPLEQPVQPPHQVSSPSPAQPTPAGSATKATGSDTKAADSGTKPPGSATKDAAADPIFSTPAPVTPADDLFGNSQSPTPATEADPFRELPSPTPAEADPFDESAEAEEMPAVDAAEQSPVEAEDTDDPFGDAADSSADEADFFGESSAADDSDTREEEDPFGESMDSKEDSSTESTEGDSAPAEDDTPAPEESDDDDPFGDFGAISPQPTAKPVAASGPAEASGSSLSAPATGNLFFALGQWFGSRSSQAPVTKAKYEATQTEAVAQAGFELGPSDDGTATPAAAESTPESDPFAESLPSSDSSESNSTESAEDDPFGDF